MSDRPGPRAFALAVGLRRGSSLWRLRLADGAQPGSPAFPGGLVLRALDPDPDEADFVALVNEAFLDHPWPLHLTVEDIRRAHASPDFDPSNVLVATSASDPGRLLGFCRVLVGPADDGTLEGEIRLVGVRREARGIGLGRALTTWGIERVRAAGVTRVALAVEGGNDTALRLYRGLGFGPEVEWPHWTVPATDDPMPRQPVPPTGSRP